MSKGTDRRTVRIAPELWDAARAVAHERGETISDVIRRDLLAYVREQPTCPAVVARLAAAGVIAPQPGSFRWD